MERLFILDSSWRPRFCPACSARAHRIRYFKEQVPYAACDLCRTVFVNPLPPDSVLNELYNAEWTGLFTDPDKIARDFEPDRFRREVSVLPKSHRRGALLDVGCQSGSFMEVARKIGFQKVSGIDIAEAPVKYANRRLGDGTAICGNFLERPFDEASFEVVTLWATLEHLSNPDCFLDEAYRVLKPGGSLAISVPSCDGLSMRLLGPRWHMVGLEHLNYYTRKGLAHTLRRHGFRVETMKSRSFNPFSFALDFRGRHLVTQWRDSQLLNEGKRNANMRKNIGVRFAEHIVDRAVQMLGVGDLLVAAATKTP